MTKEDKSLLLKDLCARLPYRVIVSCKIVNYNIEEDAHDNHPNHTIHPEYNGNGVLYLIDCLTNRVQIRPLLKGLDYKEQVYFEHISNNGYASIDYCKPYLRPMSSMTEEEIKEFYDVEGMDAKVGYIKPTWNWHFTVNGIDWLNAHHFDYRGLIEKGLAIEVTEENNPYKE